MPKQSGAACKYVKIYHETKGPVNESEYHNSVGAAVWNLTD